MKQSRNHYLTEQLINIEQRKQYSYEKFRNELTLCQFMKFKNLKVVSFQNIIMYVTTNAKILTLYSDYEYWLKKSNQLKMRSKLELIKGGKYTDN